MLNLLTRICTCSEYRISWKLKTRHVAPFLQLQMSDALCAFCKNCCSVLYFPASPPVALPPLCFLAYKTRHQGQTSGLISKASGSLGGDSFRFFWQVITEAVWWKDRRTIVTTFPLFFPEVAYSGWEIFLCSPSDGIWRKYRPVGNTPDTCATFLTPQSWSEVPNLGEPF